MTRSPLPALALAALVAASLLLAACATTPPPAPPPPPPKDLGELMDRIVAAYGGREALARVNGYAFTGSVEDKDSYHGGGGKRVSFRRTFSLPDRLKVMIVREGGTEVRIVDGARGWRNGRNGGEIEEVTGKPLQGMQLQAARAALPWILLEKRDQVTLGPPLRLSQEKDGKTVSLEWWVLHVPLRDGMLLKAIVDPGNGLVMGAGGYLSARDPSNMSVFETHFDDFNPDGGVFFPRLERTFAGPVVTGMQKINTVTVNPAFPEGEFRP